MSSIVAPRDIFALEDHERYLSVANWSDVPIIATHLIVGMPHKDLPRLSEFPCLEHLWHSCGADVLASLPEMPKLRTLRLSSVTRVPLMSLEPLSRFPSLERLILHHVPMVHSLDALTVLARLKDLLIENSPGSITKLHELDSLQPLVLLRSLECLALRGIRVRRQGLSPLEYMTWLKTLVVNNSFEIEEFARLAAALPNTEGFCLHATVPIAMPTLPCRKSHVDWAKPPTICLPQMSNQTRHSTCCRIQQNQIGMVVTKTPRAIPETDLRTKHMGDSNSIAGAAHPG